MKKTIWILVIVIIAIFICVICFLNNILGNNKYDLKGISEAQKQEIIALLNCMEIADDIELIEMQIPKAYKDISYEIYFKTDNKSIKDYVSKAETDLYGIDFKELNQNNYRCIVYRKDDKSIDLLEAIADGK